MIVTQNVAAIALFMDTQADTISMDSCVNLLPTRG